MFCRCVQTPFDAPLSRNGSQLAYIIRPTREPVGNHAGVLDLLACRPGRTPRAGQIAPGAGPTAFGTFFPARRRATRGLLGTA